ncbi:cupin domain-containing protein [Alteriqipengyuania lutimaris]|uniref:Cupin n=1 Tax=Alteriqipengyuania lutimaris TaxID=1538146 RepID=A0A395LRD1_9SPHN|nr:cupin domain-containing protein [Alteriqipengyuania lutimaris]MBB3033830.1 hypothetical protein [Alteriqipengyuania lutimaris]RDS77200.1 cupin [Alteriqipengyuania lutimaris]
MGLTCEAPAPAGLAALLGAMDRDDFVSRHWGKEPVVIDGAPDRFDGLMATGDVDRLLHFAELHPPRDIMLVRESRHYDVNWMDDRGRPRSYQVRAAWHDGYSIVLNDVARFWEPVARYCAALHADIHHPVDANLYLTPAGTRGFDPHFDVMDVFVLQLEGSKEWSLWGEARAMPLADEHMAIDPAQLPDPRWTGTLAAGQTLYIPRGHIHAARATDERSLHLTIGVKVTTWLDFLSAAMEAARSDPRYRESLPLGFLDTPPGMEDALAERVEALPSWITLGGGRAALARTMTDAAPLPREGLLAEDVPLGKDTALTRREGVICVAEGDTGQPALIYSGGILRGPAKIAEAIAFVAARRDWSPQDLPGLGEREALVLARRLVREGVVHPAARK